MEWLKRIVGTSRRTPTSIRVPQTSGALIRALEPRMMFDGAAVATTVDAAQTADATQTDASASDPTTDQASAPSATQPDGSGVAAAGPQVVFIDSRLDGYQQLLGAIQGDVEVVVLDGSGNALEQMAQWAESHQGYSAIHLVGHGSSGSLQLGDLWLQEGTIAEQQPLLAQLGAALSADGDILLYGCDVAAGSQGASFVDALAAATGADVAASTDATGSASRGGDWELEYRSGDVEAPLVLDTQQLAGADILLTLPSNGIKDLTDATAYGTFFPGFTLAASDSLLGDPGDNTLFANGVYLDSMPGDLSGDFTVSADGSNLGSFDLTGISLAKYTNDGNFTFTVTGYKLGGGEVTTTFATLSGYATIDPGNYSSFTGITGFKIQIDGDFLNPSNITFDSFTVANVAAPDVAPSLVATGSNPTFTEKGSAVDLFSGVSALTNDSGQTFTGMTLTVANPGNGTSETLNIAGTDIPLVVSNGSIAGIGSYDIFQTQTQTQTGNTINITLYDLSLSDTQMSALIDGMTYRNASNDPTGASRVVTITSLTDSGHNSYTVTTASSTVSIAPVNDAPSLNVPSSIRVTEDVASPLTGIFFDDADAGGNSVTVVMSDDSGLGSLAAVSGGNVTVSGSGSAALTLSGSIAALNAFVAAGNVTYTTASNATAGTMLLVSIDDGGNTGSGGAKFDYKMVNLQVDAVNDAPSVTVSGSQTVVEDVPTPLGGIVFDDVDAGSGNVTVILSEVDDLGSLAAVSGGNVTVSGSGSTQLTLSGSIADLNAFIAAGNVTYITASNANIDVRLLVSIDDGGNTGAGGAKVTNRMVYLQVVAVNDPPVLIATGGTPTYTENGSAVDLFSGVGVGAGDSGQSITGLTLTVANLVDGAQEILTIEGTDIPLIDGFSTTTAVTGMTASVSLVGGTATVTLSKASGLSASSTYDLVNGITYRNESDAPGTATPRVVTLTSITDNGGTANGGIDTAALSIAATVTVAATNDATVVTTSGGSATFIEADGVGSVPVAIDPGLTLSDPDSATLASATVNISGNFQSGEDLLSFVNDGSTMGNIVASYDAGTGTLTLTSAGASASLGQWQAALRAVSYGNSSETPNTATRVIAFSVNDGGVVSSNSATVMVSAVNDAPVNGMPGAQAVDQDSALVFGTAYGNAITVSDVDAAGGSLRVTLTAGNGLLTLAGTTGLSFQSGDGANDASMTFEGSLTDINQALDGLRFTPTPGYNGPASLQIVSDDRGLSGSGGAQSDTDSIAITVNSVNPRVSGVSATSPDGGYKVGDTLLLTVTFDQAVTVDSSGGAPSLLMETGSVDRSAAYASGSGSNTLTFAYTVQAGDVNADLDYGSTAALALNGATIRNAYGDDALATLPTPGSAGSLGANKNIVIDGVAPLVSSVGVPVDGTYVAGQNLDFTVNLSEAVSVDTSGGTPRLAVTLGDGSTAYAQYLSGSGSTSLVFRLTVASGQLDQDGIVLAGSLDLNGGTLLDSVGNPAQTALNGVAATTGVRIDAVAPQVASVAVPADGDYNAGSVLTFTVQTSETVVVDSSGGTPRLALDIGGTTRYASYVSGSGSGSLVFQYSVQAGDSDADGLAVGSLDLNGGSVRDGAGNALLTTLNGVADTAGVQVDTTAPTVSAIVRLGASPTSAGSVSYQVSFDEAVSGVDAGDFVLATTGSASGSIASVTQIDARTYKVVVGGLSGEGTLTLELPAAGSGVVDRAGNSVLADANGDSYELIAASTNAGGNQEFRSNPTPIVINVDTSLPRPVGDLAAPPSLPLSSTLFAAGDSASGLPSPGLLFRSGVGQQPGLVAQVFSAGRAAGDGAGRVNAGAFGTSMLAAVFAGQRADLVPRDYSGEFASTVMAEGPLYGAGAPSLGQQLEALGEAERQQWRELARVLGQLGMNVPQG